MTGFALGGQGNTTNELSDCFQNTEKVVAKLDNFYDSFKTFSYSDYMKPIYTFNELFIENVNQMSACNFQVKTKQLSTRLSTWSGLFNLVFTAGWAFIDHNNSPLYKAFKGLGSASSCKDIGGNLG